MNEVRDAAKDIAQHTDCRQLVRQLVSGWAPKQRTEARTLQGPCPKCAGDDRFYVTSDGAACTHCHPQRMDAVGLVAWLRGCTMAEAVRELDAGALRAVASVAPTVHARDVQPDDWCAKWTKNVRRYAQQLYTEAGAHGRQYLLSRGLQPDTWGEFSLGYVAARSLTKDRTQEAPAITWPLCHQVTGAVVAVRFRYVGATATGDRYDGAKDSDLVGHLFGTDALPEFVRMPPEARRLAEGLRCLFVCEGEFNAMSVWQACNATGVDVLSFGSEAQRTLPAWAVDVAGRYGQIVVWVDDTDKALQVTAQLPRPVALRSPVVDGHKWDANALLVAGRLSGLVQTARLRAAAPAQRESILWQLWDAWEDGHLDAGAEAVGRSLAVELGRTW